MVSTFGVRWQSHRFGSCSGAAPEDESKRWLRPRTPNSGDTIAALRKGEQQQELAADPRYRRWLNQCAACRRIGYKPELPRRTTARLRLGSDFADYPTWIGHAIRTTFEPLPLDERELCDICRHHVDGIDAP